ncbi:peptidoglycan/xylan/chitin deacetylase (PgdA/CDA1 family) [Paenibacillus sp. JGP012]|uniref:polysaccharide deacetylase family protein n=1 Tax=Paenibacillus sp. JGP012 TaxID=2735914 RepID=UPI00161245FA|nr:polysaccharide deacetylase family protein [Paenibacillus sp. JGP012]MBB6024528.1 peptidoglycan/xylan/chitin deacetylase (PgdA/CDA1 family) [Paenibacillus sp. JGP012]
MLHIRKTLTTTLAILLLFPLLFLPLSATATAASADKAASKANAKIIYLTFDDGPTAHTGKLLDILDQYKVKATFFMLGPHMEQYQQATKRIVKEGHGLGLHGVTHVPGKFYKSAYSGLKEMQQANESLNKVAGVKTSLIRTPYGSKPYLKPAYRNVLLGQGGFHLWDWNVDSLDWKYKKDHQKVYNNVMQQVHNVKKQGTTPVVLMHDQEATLKVLPQVLKALKAEGYQFEILTKNVQPVNFWNDKR